MTAPKKQKRKRRQTIADSLEACSWFRDMRKRGRIKELVEKLDLVWLYEEPCQYCGHNRWAHAEVQRRRRWLERETCLTIASYRFSLKICPGFSAVHHKRKE